MEYSKKIFGQTPDGTPVEEITLEKGALSCTIITYGGAVRSLTVPDQKGSPVDVVLGFDTLEDYMIQDKFIGALIGRYANRIGGAKFALNGVEYRLDVNDGENSLHGGTIGFDKQIWTVDQQTENSVALSLISPSGQGGYPGTLAVQVTYTLSLDGLDIEYWAKSDQDTVCNLTNHSYFNLSGCSSGSVLDQYIRLNASRYTPTVPGSIPTGELASVEGTPMDLRTVQPIGAHIDDSFAQLSMCGGYDHNWVVDRWDRTLRPIAWTWSPNTGIAMTTLTSMPGVQFYTGNVLGGAPAGKGGVVYQNRHGFCLETQFFPDSPNQPGFPSSLLKAGEEYRSKTAYHFSIAKSSDVN